MQKTEKQIEQNLLDAGCGEDFIHCFMDDLAQGKFEAGLLQLQKHRRFLLERTHEWQKKIDCLDYLIYQLKQTRS